MPDNRRVVMSFASASEPSRLYVVDAVSGTTSVLSSGTTSELQPAVSPDGTRLAFMEQTIDYNVLQVDVRTGDVSPILATRRNEDMPAWAMKSDVMAYVTDRSGGPEIWLHQPGRPDRPVVTATDFPQSTTLWFMSPVVSPDGARIIYGRVDPGGANLMWVSSLSGGAPVRATNTSVQHEEYPGSWSPDGVWFVYWDETSASLNRIRTTGQVTPEVLVPHIGSRGSAVPVWSPTGEWILHNRDGWRLQSSDGKTERDLGLKARVCAFSRDGAQLHCVRTEGPRGVLFARPVAGGPERVIARLAPSQVPSTEVGPALRMTLTPDGQSLTFSAAKTESGLWLLEGIGAR
jgi:Tol biopolymer transport system component